MTKPYNFSPVELADLIAVFDTGSMTQAAALNQRTKPAVSQAISRIEKTVGFSVLHRPSWNVQFTEQGEALVAKARSVMAELESLSRFAETLATGTEPSVALAIDQAVPEGLWSEVVNKVTKAHPETRFELIAADGYTACELVRDGKVQAALMVDTPLQKRDDGMEWLVVGEIELAEVFKLGTAFHGQDRPSSLPEIVLNDSASHPDCPHSPRCISVSSRLNQVTLVNGGIGWARLPAHLIHEQLQAGDLVQLPRSPDASYYASVAICRPKETAGPVANLLWQTLKNVAQKQLTANFTLSL